MLWVCLDVADIHADIPYVVTVSLIPLYYMYLETARYVPLDVSLTFPDSTPCTDEVVNVISCMLCNSTMFWNHMWYSVPWRALCTKLSKLIYLHLFTGCFMKISPQSSKKIQLCATIYYCTLQTSLFMQITTFENSTLKATFCYRNALWHILLPFLNVRMQFKIFGVGLHVYVSYTDVHHGTTLYIFVLLVQLSCGTNLLISCLLLVVKLLHYGDLRGSTEGG